MIAWRLPLPRRLRILLVEDHETVRQGLRLLIDREPDLEVIGEASDGAQAIERGAFSDVDVVVMDISMPGVSGVIATRKLKELRPELPVVSLTRHADQTFLEELLRAGASAYVLKQSPHAELLRAIRAAAAGQQYHRSRTDASPRRAVCVAGAKADGPGVSDALGPRDRSVAFRGAGPQQQGNRRSVGLEQQDHRGPQSERHAQAWPRRED